MTAPESITPAPFAYYRASSVSGINLLDIGAGTGGTLTGAANSFGTTSTSNGWGVAGKSVAIGDGFSAYWQSATSSPWTPLSNGSGATIAIYFRPTAAGSPYILLDTGGLDPSKDGIFVQYDPTLERIGLDFTRSAGSGRVIDWINGARFSWKGTCAVGVPHVLVITISSALNPNIVVYLDGHPIDKLNVDDRQRGTSSLGTIPPDPEPRTFGTSVAGYDLRVLAPISGGGPQFQGELAEIGFWSSALSSSNIELLWQWAESNYGLTMTRGLSGLILWDGDSLTDNVWRTNQYPELVTPSLRQSSTNLMRAVAGMEINQEASRAAKQVTPFIEAARPFNILIAWGDFINEIGNGSTKETAYAEYVTYCQARRAEGWRVVAAPLLPAISIPEATSDYITAQVVTNWATFADAIARVDTDSILNDYAGMVSDYGGGTGPRIYRSDGTHFTALGNSMIAPYFVSAINPLLLPRVIVRAAS